MLTPWQTVVIVGASRGIGRALAEHYGERGIATLACARSPVELPRVMTMSVDVTDEPSLTAPAIWVGEHDSPRLIAVTAAELGPVGHVTQTDAERWLHTLNVNVVGVVRILRQFLPVLSQRDRIVVFTGGGVGGPRMQPRVGAYTASKGALAFVIEGVGRDPLNQVPIIGVAPGPFPTDFTKEVLQSNEEVVGLELLDQTRKNQAGPFDISNLVAALDLLAHPRADRFSGRVLAVQRDDLPGELETVEESDAMFRMRRVDGHSVHADPC